MTVSSAFSDCGERLFRAPFVQDFTGVGRGYNLRGRPESRYVKPVAVHVT
jgi:hypothetical protein